MSRYSASFRHKPFQNAGRARGRAVRWVCLLAAVIAASVPAAAQIVKPSDSALSRLAFRSEELAPSQVIVPLGESQNAARSAALASWEAFRGRAKADWRASI